MQALADKLGPQLAGEVRADEFSRKLYSVDASLYRIEPQLVVLPKSREDILATIDFARAEGLGIVPRGAATGLAGGCVGPGIVVDMSKYLNKIREINLDEGWAICEAGVVQDQLNAAVAAKGWRFGPDTSTGNRATVGGMLGNNSSGAHSMRYGKTVDNVLSCDLLTADGQVHVCGPLDEAGLAALAAGQGTLARVAAFLQTVRRDLPEEIARVYPQIQRRVAGYNLDAIVQPWPINLAQLVCGAEGSFGITDVMKLRLSRSPRFVGLCILHCEDLLAGLDRVPEILTHVPFALELMDGHIIRAGRSNPTLHDRLTWLQGEPDGILAVEFDAETPEALTEKMERFAADAATKSWGYACVALRTPAEMGHVWQLRKAGLGLLMGRRSVAKALPFLEDLAVPPARVGAFAREFSAYMQGHGKELGIYGHAGVGLLHFRPMLDLRQKAQVDEMLQMMHEISDLVQRYGGAVSGEHGDGLVRSWLIEKMFGPTLYRAFQELKSAFDPENRMNPGKIVNAQQPTENLRIGPGTPEIQPATFLNFDAEGGFAFAVEMCNGNAECRKPRSGLMCPSFQASGDERDSTRGRATALQAIIHGHSGLDRLSGKGLYEVLDLCLACKGCKQECPSQVDMAKLKSEVLYQYQEKHGVPLRSRLFADVDRLNRWGSRFAPLSNWVNRSGPGKAMLKRLGLAPEREMPPFTRKRFSRWYQKRGGSLPARRPANRPGVLLLVDTHMEYNYPELGRDAVAVIEALGCQLAVTSVGSLGRPAMSKGLLPQARNEFATALSRVMPYVREGKYRLVGLEPSYVSMLQDDGPSLLDDSDCKAAAKVAQTIDEFLAEQTDAFAGIFRADPVEVWLHGHCHQKALSGTGPTMQVLRALPGVTAHEIDSGCCGMAGSFGYEAEHHEFSLQVGETRLFPAIRALPTDAILIADGISCRAQIKDGTQRQALHLVQFLAARLSAKT